MFDVSWLSLFYALRYAAQGSGTNGDDWRHFSKSHAPLQLKPTAAQKMAGMKHMWLKIGVRAVYLVAPSENTPLSVGEGRGGR